MHDIPLGLEQVLLVQAHPYAAVDTYYVHTVVPDAAAAAVDSSVAVVVVVAADSSAVEPGLELLAVACIAAAFVAACPASVVAYSCWGVGHFLDQRVIDAVAWVVVEVLVVHLVHLHLVVPGT